MQAARHAARQLFAAPGYPWLPAPPQWPTAVTASVSHLILHPAGGEAAGRRHIASEPTVCSYALPGAPGALEPSSSRSCAERAPPESQETLRSLDTAAAPSGKGDRASSQAADAEGWYSPQEARRVAEHSPSRGAGAPSLLSGWAQGTALNPPGPPWGYRPLLASGQRILGRRGFAAKVAAEAPASAPLGFAGGKYRLEDFPPERIRNFGIIAHVDHGKSTLADRLLELTGAIQAGGQAQFLDKLQVERERGITVKAQTVTVVHRYKGHDYLLNLIDTPGHVDFSYEVSRSLAACQGALLLVDASQGIQAQTMANFFLAFEQDLAIVPVLNKVDLASAEPERVALTMKQVFDIEPESCLLTSAKTGLGLEAVLPAVIERMPAPAGNPGGDLRMLLFDAYHDEYRGVICLVEVVDGRLDLGDRVAAMSTGEVYDVLEVGVLAPEPTPTGKLLTGQVGYVILGIKTTKAARVGDTLHAAKKPVTPLPGFRPAKSMVFAGVFPLVSGDFEGLTAAVERLTLNDASVTVTRETSNALGAGFRCGFLGLLHMDVFHQRLEQEHGESVILTPPTVPYTLHLQDGETLRIQNPSMYPTDQKVLSVSEPTVSATVVTPTEHVGQLMLLCQDRRGELKEHSALGAGRTLLKYVLPLAELGGDFYDELKSRSSGYASFDYEESGERPASLVRLDLLLNGEPVDALARVVHRDKAQRAGRLMVAKMKDLMTRQQVDIAIQAAANNKIIARETIKAFRKNVLAKCYGGDVSRKRKLLEKQKAGKKRMGRRLGSVDVPQEVFHALVRN